jgi:hypothetical protein
MVIQNAPTIRSTLIDAAVYGPKSSYTDSKGVLTDGEIDAIARYIKVGRWNVYGAVRILSVSHQITPIIPGRDTLLHSFFTAIRVLLALIVHAHCIVA